MSTAELVGACVDPSSVKWNSRFNCDECMEEDARGSLDSHTPIFPSFCSAGGWITLSYKIVGCCWLEADVHPLVAS
ncbi:unnamed protein product [Prunus armeniaca]